jgi:hypothetical protein
MDELTFALFGTLHPVWPSEPLFAHLRALGRKITITHGGGIGRGAALWETMERKYGADFTFRRLGQLSPIEAAEYLHSADFGIATTPWALIGKSGSVAAMLDMGLPVVVNRDDVRYHGHDVAGPLDPLLLPMNGDFTARLNAARRRAPRLHLPEVAAQFLVEWEGANRA